MACINSMLLFSASSLLAKYSTNILLDYCIYIPCNNSYIYGSILLVKILCPLCGILYCLHKYTISICTYVCIYDMKILIHKLYLLVALSLMETVLEQMDFACRRQTVGETRRNIFLQKGRQL